MMKTQLMAGMALSIVLAGSLMPTAWASDKRPSTLAPTAQEKGNHLADKAQPDKMAAKAVQLISEKTNQPIANTSIVITNDDVHPCPCGDFIFSWEGKTDASGIIMIPRQSIPIRDDHYQGRIYLKISIKGYRSDSTYFDFKEFFDRSRVPWVHLEPLDKRMPTKAVQLISEETHQPIANTLIVVNTMSPWIISYSDPSGAVRDDSDQAFLKKSWSGKTDASGMISIPRNMISGRDAGHLDILAKRSSGGDLGIAVDEAFLNEPGVFKATLFDPDTRWRNKVTNRAVQVISEVTHKPIVHQSIFVMTHNGTICENINSYCPDRDVWEGKTDASGIIVIPRDVILSAYGKTFEIATFNGTICKNVRFCLDNDLWDDKTDASHGGLVHPINLASKSGNEGNLSNRVDTYSKLFLNDSEVFKVNLLTASSVRLEVEKSLLGNSKVFRKIPWYYGELE
jgi:hypothetical protein